MADRDGDGRTERATARGWTGGRIGAAAFLTLVWMMLWGSTSWLTALGGAVIAVALMTAFRQPAMPLGVGPHPGRLLVALGWVLIDVVRSTVTVAWAAVRWGPATRSELIRVVAPACSSEILVLASSLISISPGTMVVEIDNERSELLVHVLPVQDLERSRTELRRTTERLVRALQGGLLP
jgi:multicomponent Na+:H+ antiporter subunit E